MYNLNSRLVIFNVTSLDNWYIRFIEENIVMYKRCRLDRCGLGSGQVTGYCKEGGEFWVQLN